MKQKIICTILILILLSSYACTSKTPDEELSESGNSSVSDCLSSSSFPAETTQEIISSTEKETSTAVQAEESTVMHTEPKTTSASEITEQEQTVAQVQTTAAPQELTQVDLNITMPEANGKMQVETSPSNKYIAAIADEEGIDEAFLAAVFSVPESGQNYVFEFKSKNLRSADNIRRVYLLDSACKIISVAASDSSERKNISATENWFCMNVLIKKVIFPAVEDQF